MDMHLTTELTLFLKDVEMNQCFQITKGVSTEDKVTSSPNSLEGQVKGVYLQSEGGPAMAFED